GSCITMAELPALMFTKVLSHRQKVMRLYERALWEVDNWYGRNNLEVRYQKVFSRARHDANKVDNYTRNARLLFVDGCRQSLSTPDAAASIVRVHLPTWYDCDIQALELLRYSLTSSFLHYPTNF
ncbi:hypothetical protein PMAYCL1PPCAC_21908, partial [Pristionchus mayeri]